MRTSTPLLAVSFLAFLLSAACTEPNEVVRTEVFTTIDGVVRLRADSAVVPQALVRAIEFDLRDLQNVIQHEHASVRTDSNGAFRISFTASCAFLQDGDTRRDLSGKLWRLRVASYRTRVNDVNDMSNVLSQVCEVPEFQVTLWVAPN